uniref:tRNA (adenine(22)-N(1))-methyltransferase TrmK n=1 Tax=Bacillus velezensis TaxID=492670 RepID=UPI001643EDD6
CYAVLNDLASGGMGGEIREGGFVWGKEEVEKVELRSLMWVRKGEGVRVVEKGEGGVIRMVGMGGVVMGDILEWGKRKLRGGERVIVEGNTDGVDIREWV